MTREWENSKFKPFFLSRFASFNFPSKCSQNNQASLVNVFNYLGNPRAREIRWCRVMLSGFFSYTWHFKIPSCFDLSSKFIIVIIGGCFQIYIFKGEETFGDLSFQVVSVVKLWFVISIDLPGLDRLSGHRFVMITVGTGPHAECLSFFPEGKALSMCPSSKL